VLRFVLVELLLICSSFLIATVTILQAHLKEICFDLGAEGGEISKVYYLLSGPISQF